MRLISALAAGAAALALPALSMAQTVDAPTAGASNQPAPTPAAANAGVSATIPGAAVISGLAVKDKTGATIGQVTEVKTEAGGKKTATIKMGADTFAVDTSALAVENGAAVINASEAEIKAMLPKK